MYLLVHRELKRVREMMIPTGVVLVLAIVVPWYAALYQRYGWTYITSFIRGENIARFTEGVGVESRRGPLFYIPVVFSDSFPWSLCLFGAAGLWVADWRSRAAAVLSRQDRTATGRPRLPDPHAPVALGPRHRRLLQLVGGEAGSLHLSHRAGGGGARGTVHRP